MPPPPPKRKIGKIAKMILMLAILVPTGGTIVMALGFWLEFTSNNPVLNTVYIMIVASFGIWGFMQLLQLDET